MDSMQHSVLIKCTYPKTTSSSLLNAPKQHTIPTRSPAKINTSLLWSTKWKGNSSLWPTGLGPPESSTGPSPLDTFTLPTFLPSPLDLWQCKRGYSNWSVYFYRWNRSKKVRTTTGARYLSNNIGPHTHSNNHVILVK